MTIDLKDWEGESVYTLPDASNATQSRPWKGKAEDNEGNEHVMYGFETNDLRSKCALLVAYAPTLEGGRVLIVVNDQGNKTHTFMPKDQFLDFMSDFAELGLAIDKERDNDPE